MFAKLIHVPAIAAACLVAATLPGNAAHGATVPTSTGSPGNQASTAGPNDPIPGCDIPSNSWWFYCWGNSYGGPYTQAWIGPFEYDNTYGWHHNLHLQPRGLGGNTDYMNQHIYFYGVTGQGGGSQYTFRIYCSDSSGYRQCSNWNNAGNNTGYGPGQMIWVPTTQCLGDGYNCASNAAGDMKDCLTSPDSPPYGCSYTYQQDFINADFPNIATNILQKDAIGDPGTLQNAFCDALNTFKTCSKH